jgi:hypothetical protein
MRTKKWSELNETQKTVVLTLISTQIALLLTALIDLRRRPATEINGSKRLWTALAFVNFIGPIAYFVWGRKRNAP